MGPEQMSKKVIAILALSYAATWAGGWITHSREIEARAARMYSRAQKRDRETAEVFQREGLGPYKATRLRKGGPSSGVSWCFPLLPGVLLADSWYVVGPLWGKGGMKLVVYYGFGAREVVFLWGWIS
jgi:hypothetical protein